MPETTTIEVKYDTWRALDIRKDRGESFDDIIRRMVGELGPDVGEIKTDTNINSTDFKPVGDEEAEGEECMQYDMVAGEVCGGPVQWKQQVSYGEEPTESGDTMYYCDEHGPHE
ncbi:hypothetical protein HSTV1_2 [Haloarcula sinaiiensis tailed virus 1]|uniref:Uncharacterized protein n=1 Tax=Haloarcula sinaiiensis tailed virus 1 TaxID=1262530 RepID=R9QSP0_9CAUD|nr:hypothetical protein HSTV1_2 [Haloarcula sinaiiensis tailed virus 1]AGC34547.1 hypothetical protein HSTV1_2 [Haloarcula sinaiiensis tailed virus 1]